ncbi:hypothetical protein KUTeg_009674 [Tegillarca granosa]|uniref:Uncharacterized protein n=1 Tax=Tegillarca granosa TaxID=220873 RepID=A0ABQ9F6W3_TEGGR|nr:hypothetical protein KUTeg_009674 [Tegillarca granosa]
MYDTFETVTLGSTIFDNRFKSHPSRPKELLLRKLNDGNLKKTLYGFSGYEGHQWTLAMDLPRASLEPDINALNSIKTNQQQNQDILNAIERDANGVILDNICAYSDSYGVGKEIGFVARLASISRAFGTQHYTKLDDNTFGEAKLS